jgi:hypothetical protein
MGLKKTVACAGGRRLRLTDEDWCGGRHGDCKRLARRAAAAFHLRKAFQRVK